MQARRPGGHGARSPRMIAPDRVLAGRSTRSPHSFLESNRCFVKRGPGAVWALRVPVGGGMKSGPYRGAPENAAVPELWPSRSGSKPRPEGAWLGCPAMRQRQGSRWLWLTG